jgi:hypothetical protein
MTTKSAKTRDRHPTSRIAPEIPEFEDVRVIERPDGYYWQSIDGKQERGPFPARLEAEQDLAICDGESLEVGETLEEAESEIGIAEWIDPETGELAEEEVSRIEEH